jgi:cell division protease FtsH
MSDAIGLVSVLPRPGNESPFPAADANAPAESTRELVDAEVRRIVDECYGHAVERLQENRDHLESLARALLEHETLDEQDAYAAAGFDKPPKATAAPPATVTARDLQ